MKKKLLLFWMVTLVLASCTKEPVQPDIPTFQKPGVFVVNEGNFTTGNASLTWYHSDSVFKDAFYAINKVPLGDVANYMTVHDNKGYIVINNSGVVYVIDINTGAFLDKISGLSSPREILIVDNNKAWVSDLFSKFISVVDLNTYKVVNTINLHGRTSESLVRIGDKVFVNNWSRLNQIPENNMVLVLDVGTEKIVDSVQVSLEPNSMVADANNKLWVLCSGGYNNIEIPALYRIDPVNDSVEEKLVFGQKNMNPFALNINGAGTRLWFLNNGICKVDIDSHKIPTEPLIPQGTHNFYSLGVRPDIESLYASDALDYVRNGTVYYYDSTGNLSGEFEAGIIPGSFCFIY